MSIHIKALFGILLLYFGLQQSPAPAAKKPDLRAAADVAAYLSRTTGMPVYVDSRLTKEKGPMPGADDLVTPENLVEHVAKLAKGLPTGSTWCKLYLPPMPSGKNWKADDVIAYALTQAKLYGKVGAVEVGKTEILSQQVANEKAIPVVSTLDLKPVFVITLDRNTFAGSWTTTFGEMHLKQSGNRVTGGYTSGNGSIQGTVTGRILRFQWYEEGSRRGGPGVFTLAEDGESFTGEWAYDDTTDMPSTWSGTRISRR